MDLFNEIIDLNNAAVTMLVYGNNKESASILWTANTQIQTLCETHMRESQRDKGLVSNGSFDIMENLNSREISTSLSFNDKDLFAFYNRAMEITVIGTSGIPEQSLNLCNIWRLQSIILYNLGVACHDSGIRKCKSMALNDALLMYQNSFTILQKLPKGDTVGGVYTRGFKLLLLALLNNMCHINSSFYNWRETRECIDREISILKSKHCRAYLDDDFQFFRLNMFACQMSDVTFSPAA